MSEKAGKPKPPRGPLHVLMAIPASKQHLLNARIKNDFINKRARAFRIKNSNPRSIWGNCKSIERSLIRCCEIPEDMAEDAMFGPVPVASLRKGCGYFPLLGGGALRKEKEVDFMGVVAKDCRTLSSRSLALAILERTLSMHHFELEEAEAKRLEDVEAKTAKDNDVAIEEEESEEFEEEQDSDEYEEETLEGNKRRRSLRLSKQGEK